MSHRTRLNATDALVAYRVFAGAGISIAPGITARLFGFEPDRTRFYMGRLAGSRQMALAAGTAISSGEAHGLWLRLGLACDALDTLAAVIAGVKRDASTRQAVGMAAATSVELVLSALALRSMRRPSPET